MARSWSFRLAFAIVTATMLLAEIALTRIFSGTIGYYFAFMSISIAMLGLGAGSLYVTLRKKTEQPAVTAGQAALVLGFVFAMSTLAYARFYTLIGNEQPLAPQIAVFAALFAPFLVAGILIATVFESYKAEFASLYAIDLAGAAVGCVIAVFLLDRVPAPKAMLVVAFVAASAGPLFFFAAKEKKRAIEACGLIVIVSAISAIGVWKNEPFKMTTIRHVKMDYLVADRWNDFSRVVVQPGPFFTWGLSETYTKEHEAQYDLLIEGVAGTQIQKIENGNVSGMDFFRYDIMSLPHRLRGSGSALCLGVGGGFDILMAKYFNKAPVVGVEVNPLVGEIVNEDFGAWSGHPYRLPGIDVHFENARTFVKHDTATYDVVTVTWVDSGAATGAGAFALTENYLYTVDAFRDYLARVKDDGVLAFMRARYTPDYDAVKGIAIAVAALGELGIKNPERYMVVSSVASPHFYQRELVHVMIKKQPFTDAEIATVDEVRRELHFKDLHTPGRNDGDAPITRLVRDSDRRAAYATFPFDIEPNTDDRPFYFFLREGEGHAAGHDVEILRTSVTIIFALIGAFLVVPLIALLRRGGVRASKSLIAPTIYFSLLGLGFMLVEMKLLQQSILVVGNPTLSLAAVLASLLVSTGAGAFASERLAKRMPPMKLGAIVFGVLTVLLLIALVGAEGLAQRLTALSLPLRTAGVVVAIAPLGFLLGMPLPSGMARLPDARGLVAWCWGMNGVFGVAGSAVAIYLAIYRGLAFAFLVGVGCYVIAALVYLGLLARRPTETPTAAAEAP